MRACPTVFVAAALAASVAALVPAAVIPHPHWRAATGAATVSLRRFDAGTPSSGASAAASTVERGFALPAGAASAESGGGPGSAPAAAAAPTYPQWTAHRLTSTPVEGALCLDGSPPLYYLSPGWGDGVTKFQIHHEGGAWCGSPDDCYGWWGWRSTYADPDVLPQDAQASTGYFNRSSPTNSMANWNWVFIRYCDGYSFTGGRILPTILPVTNASGTFNVTMHFRGAAVLEAVRTDLLTVRGMGTATDVVVGGCSAGGLASLLHCDTWAAAIAAASPTTRTSCLADSGWFPLVPAAGFPSTWFNGVWSGGFAWHNSSGAMSSACLAAQQPGFEWRCFMAEVAAPFVATPLFLYQSQYDSFQIFNMERCIPMPPDPASPCSDAVVTAWGGNLTSMVRAWLASPRALAAGSAAWVDSCYHHCGTWADFDEVTTWGNGNVTGSVAFGSWLARHETQLWTQPTAYPCSGTACCGPHGPDTLEVLA